MKPNIKTGGKRLDILRGLLGHMKIKANTQKEIKKIIESFVVREDNLIHAERLFVAKTVLMWAVENSKEQNIFKSYLTEIEKHLNGEITLYWEDGKIKIRKEKQV